MLSQQGLPNDGTKYDGLRSHSKLFTHVYACNVLDLISKDPQTTTTDHGGRGNGWSNYI